jgi:hypothetical protein
MRPEGRQGGRDSERTELRTAKTFQADQDNLAGLNISTLSGEWRPVLDKHNEYISPFVLL